DRRAADRAVELLLQIRDLLLELLGDLAAQGLGLLAQPLVELADRIVAQRGLGLALTLDTDARRQLDRFLDLRAGRVLARDPRGLEVEGDDDAVLLGALARVSVALEAELFELLRENIRHSIRRKDRQHLQRRCDTILDVDGPHHRFRHPDLNRAAHGASTVAAEPGPGDDCVGASDASSDNQAVARSTPEVWMRSNFDKSSWAAA